MKPRDASSLIIVDGGLAGLCAAWAAGIVATGPASRTRSETWIAAAAPRGDGAARRTGVLRALPALCRVEGVIDITDQSEPEIGFQQSLLLMAACREALSRGISRVIWPIQLGTDTSSGADSLDHLADACDRAMLAAQLANVDAGRNSMGVTIELPYLDFTDAQLIELALDMAVPLSGCWWCRSDDAVACGSCPSCIRWQSALARVNPGATLVQVVARQRAAAL